MITANTLTELIESNRHVKRTVGYLEGEREERHVSFAELYERALGILFHLQRSGAKPGDKLILYVPSNEPFIDAFWAGILGGIVPVPVSPGISDEHRHKLLRIARTLGQPFIYADRKAFERVGSLAEQAGESDVFAGLRARAFFVDQLDDISRAGKAHRASPGDTAFIQFSSGSTSEPKGVVLTHANILANGRGATEAAGFNEADVSLSWMPLTHDLGLIGMHLYMLANRIQSYLMPTELFIRRPLLWLQFATAKGVTLASSPNFGYRHYLKVLGERPLEQVDLTHLRLMFNGAEPISASLCRQFLARLAPAKLRADAMYPVYGLAEAALAVTFPRPGESLHTLWLDRHRIAVGAAPRQLAPGDRDASEFISVGRPIPHCQLRIVDEDEQLLPAGRVGHIQISGANVTRGYYENPQANAAGFTADGWLRTGDLGLEHEGALYVTGRAKDIVFVNGQNYYPHDLENIAQGVPGLDLGKVVAAGIRPPGAQADELIIFVLHRSDMADFLPLATQVARLINEHTGLEVAEVVPVTRIPKTTSGKVQRHLLEQAYVDGEFAAQLAELAQLRAAAHGPGRSSSNEIEATLKAICDAALEGKNVGIDDNLFELGASSLKLIEIHERLDEHYPGQVDLTELFDYPTIADLARHLQSKFAA
ncbi:MAG TPA: non-ribosomal peptide synthetase [Steroidobacteraceae bacterium]